MKIEVSNVLRVGDIEAGLLSSDLLSFLASQAQPTYLDSVDGMQEHIYNCEDLLEGLEDGGYYASGSVQDEMNEVQIQLNKNDCSYFRVINHVVAHLNQAQQLADEFSRQLLASIGKDNLAQVNNLNRIEYEQAEDYSTCGSHDFCDANMVMDAAFQVVVGREYVFYDEEKPETEKQNAEDTELINEAWSIAKLSYFNPSK